MTRVRRAPRALPCVCIDTSARPQAGCTARMGQCSYSFGACVETQCFDITNETACLGFAYGNCSWDGSLVLCSDVDVDTDDDTTGTGPTPTAIVPSGTPSRCFGPGPTPATQTECATISGCTFFSGVRRRPPGPTPAERWLVRQDLLRDLRSCRQRPERRARRSVLRHSASCSRVPEIAPAWPGARGTARAVWASADRRSPRR